MSSRRTMRGRDTISVAGERPRPLEGGDGVVGPGPGIGLPAGVVA